MNKRTCEDNQEEEQIKKKQRVQNSSISPPPSSSQQQQQQQQPKKEDEEAENKEDDSMRFFKGFFRWFPSRKKCELDSSARELYEHYEQTPKLTRGDIRKLRFPFSHPKTVEDLKGVPTKPRSSVIDKDMNKSVQEIMNTKRVAAHTPEWFEKREKCLTASEVASILGFNPYQTATEIFKKKLKFASPDMNASGAKACEHGHTFEPVAACLYEALTGYKVIEEEIGFFRHKRFHFLGGTPDRLLKNYPIPVEIKCPIFRKISMDAWNQKTKATQGMPLYYYCQVQMQMFILGFQDFHTAHYVEFKPYLPPTTPKQRNEQMGILCIREIDFDEKWFRKQIPIIYGFWKAMETYPTPEKTMTKEEVQKRKGDRKYFVPSDIDNMMLYNYPKAFHNLATRKDVQTELSLFECRENTLDEFIQYVIQVMDGHTSEILQFLQDPQTSHFKKREILDKEAIRNKFADLDTHPLVTTK